MIRRCAWLLLAALGCGIAADRLLPPDLSRYQQRSTVVMDSTGSLLRGFTSPDGYWRIATGPDDVDPRYLELLLAYEDRRFWHHPGVDALAMGRAVAQMIAHGRPVSGGSTVTMQVVRLLEPRARTAGAKLIEMARALQLELRYSKRDILTMYLTLAPFGGNIEGVGAASLMLLGKPPDRLTTSEAALLVALPQAPVARRPDRHPEAARIGRNRVLERAGARGVLEGWQVAEAREEALPARRRDMPFLAPHLAQRLAERAPAGAKIATTIDHRLQAAVEAMASREAAWFGDGASLAAVVVEHARRDVRAYLGGHDFFGAEGQVDLARALRSPGSTLKPFVYGLAFDALIAHPEMRIADLPARFAGYAPRNFDSGFRGSVTVREALQHSLNIPAIAVMQRLGPERFVAALEDAGARLQMPDGKAAPGLPIALGGVGMTLEDLAMLYAALADGGGAAPLRYLTHEPAAVVTRRFLSAETSATLGSILSDAPRPDSIAAANAIRRIAYKTGTSYGFRDAWAVGFSDRYTVAVWVGRPDGTPRPGAYGRSAAAPILFKIFDLLPAEEVAPYQPPASRAPTPRNLRQFEDEDEGPRIMFPPDGALVELQQESVGLRPLTLKAEGGALPLRWLVNGAPVAVDAGQPGAFWRPDGEGFAHIAVIDAANRVATADVRVTPSR